MAAVVLDLNPAACPGDGLRALVGGLQKAKEETRLGKG